MSVQRKFLGSSRAKTTRELLRLAKPVSRTFYLTMQWLPEALRLEVTLAYLLARASDTIADSLKSDPRLRLDTLHRIRERQIDLNELSSIQHVAEKENLLAGEAELLENLSSLLAILNRIDSRDLIDEVWGWILLGQIQDVEREAAGLSGEAFGWEETLKYAYYVAGSVGEFWTKLGMRRDASFSTLEESSLLCLGREYGIALQLLNICRDLEKDAKVGRAYLAREDVPRARRRIQAGLQAGETYGKSLRNKRLRFASLLPAEIGFRMIEETQGFLKPDRKQIRQIVFRCGMESFFGK